MAKYDVDFFWKTQPQTPDDFLSLGNRFFQYLKQIHYSQQTIDAYRIHLRLFVLWCNKRSLFTPKAINHFTMDIYQHYLARNTNKKDKIVTAGHRKNRIAVLSKFFSWLTKNNYILNNPTDGLESPKVPKRLPRNCFTHEEVEQIMQQPNINRPSGLRDRAILELMYSIGIRRGEVPQLQLSDIDFNRKTILIRAPKTRKDRIVPLGKRAAHWLQKYLDESRPKLLQDLQPKLFFLNKNGEQLHYHTVSNRTSNYIKAANISKQGSCHTFRHSMATLMLENGADIRYIKEILGHSKLSTTNIYTQVSIAKLKEIHTLTHPATTKHTKTKQVLSELDLDIDNLK